jgi:hypothetical protein
MMSPFLRKSKLDEPITKYDVAMDLITILYLGSERRLFSDRDGSLQRAISASLNDLPFSFSDFFSPDPAISPMRIRLGEVLAAATELEMITWRGDDLDEFEIRFDDNNAALRAAAANIPLQTMCDMGRVLSHSISAEKL